MVVHLRMHIVSQVAAPFYLSSNEVVISHLPVHAGIAIEGAAEVFVQKRFLVLEEPVFPRCGPAEGLLFQVTLLTGSVTGVVHAAKEVQSARAVVDIDGTERVIPVGPTQGLGIGGIQVEAEAVALPPDGTDAYHRTHRSVVLGAGVGDDLDILDLIALQAVQFTAVRHSPPVDINEGRTLADHLQAVLPLDEARRF